MVIAVCENWLQAFIPGMIEVFLLHLAVSLSHYPHHQHTYIYIYVYIYITLHLQSRHNLILNWGILPYAPPNDSKVGEHNSNFTIYGLWYLQLPIISCMGFRHVSTIFPSPRGPGLLEGLHQQVVRLRLDDFGQVRVAGVDVLKAMEVTRKTTSIPWGFPAKMVISWWFNGI